MVLRASKAGWNTLRIKLIKNGKAKEYGLAKLVYKAFFGKEIGRKEIIRYRDGNPCNCSVDNLYIISMTEEVLNEIKNGRRKIAKFDYYDEEVSIRDIEKDTGMSIGTVWTRIKTLKWNIYETVETPLCLTHANKKKGGKSK